MASQREGHLAAQAGDLAFLALPHDHGGCRVGVALDLQKPPERWTEADFFTVEAVRDEAAFRRRVSRLAANERDRQVAGSGELAPDTRTPWGLAQHSTLHADGIIKHETASHGGFQLDAARNALVHPAYRDKDGWYEEDIEWAKVAVTFPALFPLELEAADKLLRDYRPDAYEEVNHLVLSPSQSMLVAARIPPADRPPDPRTPTQEREALRRLNLPSHAVWNHDYDVEWHDAEHTSATMAKGDEQLTAFKDATGAWSYESPSKANDRGDILDFEIHRGAKSIANARAKLRPELQRAENCYGRLDPQPEPAAPRAGQQRDMPPDAPSNEQSDDPRPDPDDRRRRGRGR